MRRRRCCGGVGEAAGWLGWGFGGGYRRSGEEEARGIGRRQHHTLVAARLVTGGVCVCVVFIGSNC
jgi:hypothetical protein